MCAARTAPALREALSQTDLIQNQQFELRGANGHTFWVHGSFQRMNYRGEDAIFSVYHDITEGRRALDTTRGSRPSGTR